MKKILLSMLATFLVIGLVGTSTFAWFQDTETSTGNTFTAGTLDLKIYDGNTWGDVGPTAVWTMSNMVPGETTDSGMVMVKWQGSVTPHHMEITCSYTATEGDPYGPGTPDTVNTAADPDSFAKYVEITSFDYYDGSPSWHIMWDGTKYSTSDNPPKPSGWAVADWQITDKNNDGIISLYDLKYDPLTNLPPGTQNEVIHFEMTVRFSSLAGNDLQGDTLNVTMIFTVRQS